MVQVLHRVVRVQDRDYRFTFKSLYGQVMPPENLERKEVINMDQPKPWDKPKPTEQPKPTDKPKPPVQPKPTDKPKP